MVELEFKPGMKVVSVGDLNKESVVIKSVLWRNNSEIMRLIESHDDGTIEELVATNNNDNGFNSDDELVLVEDDLGYKLYFGPTLEIVKY